MHTILQEATKHAEGKPARTRMRGKRKPGCRERHYYPNYEEEGDEETHAKIDDDWIRVETINVTHLDHNKMVLLIRKIQPS